jgi:HTH-type transcriptional regulator/antitoxin HigA
MVTPKGNPIVALTIRHDRVDNFWFTLLHELGHIALHLDRAKELGFVDDLDKTSTEAVEQEANHYAANALIPPDLLSDFSEFRHCTAQLAQSIAKAAHIHPAIVAGRVRRESGNYAALPALNARGVRTLFPTWAHGHVAALK